MWTLELIIVGCLHVVLYGQFNYLHDMDWWAVWTKKPSPEAIENEKEKQVQVHLSRFSVIRHTLGQFLDWLWTKKVEFWSWFTVQAPLEIHDAIVK